MPEVNRNRTQPFGGPARIIAAFAILIVIGAILLMAPWAARDRKLSIVDALFTSTSGVCVTGLTTISVGSQLSRSGQAILLALIQLGGLGITTVSTILLAAAGRATIGHAVSAGDTLAAPLFSENRPANSRYGPERFAEFLIGEDFPGICSVTG
jgi:Trk-type K+ transport system membrane component